MAPVAVMPAHDVRGTAHAAPPFGHANDVKESAKDPHATLVAFAEACGTHRASVPPSYVPPSALVLLIGSPRTGRSRALQGARRAGSDVRVNTGWPAG